MGYLLIIVVYSDHVKPWHLHVTEVRGIQQVLEIFFSHIKLRGICRIYSHNRGMCSVILLIMHP